jgi:hypothetical protein
MRKLFCPDSGLNATGEESIRLTSLRCDELGASLECGDLSPLWYKLKRQQVGALQGGAQNWKD